MKRQAFTIALLLAFTFTGAAVASDEWIHVQIDGKHDERVSVNLPLSLVSAAVAMMPEEFHHESHIAIDELDMSWEDMMNLWSEVKDSPDATYVTVESADETVVVRKEGEFVVVKTTEQSEHGANVDVKFPIAVIDALFSGPEGTLNFQAAVQALADHGPGNLVTVRDGDETVRVWIDNQNEAD